MRDSSSDSFHRNSEPDFPFDESVALAVDRTLAAVAVAVLYFSTIQVNFPNDSSAADDIVDLDRWSFLGWVQALTATKSCDHHARSVVDVHAKYGDPDIFRYTFCRCVPNDRSI